MANELTVTASIQYDKNNHQLSFIPPSLNVTVAGAKASSGVFTVGDSAHEALSLNEVSAADQGWAWFRNIGTDSSTHINVGVEVSSNFVPVFSLKGGEFAMMRLENQALFAKSSSGNLNLQYNILEA